MAIGIENGLAHAVVDRLLGYDRALAESRLQLTPVEWGIWTFLILRVLDGLHADTTASRLLSDDDAGAIGPGDVRLDRAGPDAFDHTAQGSIVTVRWGVRVGNVGGSVRLWIPESLVRQRLESPAPTASSGFGPATSPTAWADRVVVRGELSSLWRAVAGTLALPQGLSRLREGGLIALPDIRLSGSPASPAGPVDLVLDLEGPDGRFRIARATRPRLGRAAPPSGRLAATRAPSPRPDPRHRQG